MRNPYLCRFSIRLLGLMAALWAAGASAAEEQPDRLNRAPEIKFQKSASYAETTLQQSIAGMFGYSLAIRVTPEGRSDVSAGPLVRPLQGLEIGLERDLNRYAASRDDFFTRADPHQPANGFDYPGTGKGPRPFPVYLGQTGPLKYELQGSRLRVKYHISEDTVLSLRARFNRAEQKATAWLMLERRF